MATAPTTVGIASTGDFVTTTLNGAISAAATTMTIGTGLNIPAANGFLMIDYDSTTAVASDNGPETVKYTSYTSGTGAVTGLTRGADAYTTGVAHANGATVQAALSALHLNNLIDIIENAAWTTWTASPAGFASTTSDVSFYMQHGKTVHCFINFTGASNATTLTFTLPVAAQRATEQMGFSGLDNSSRTGVRPRLDMSAASTTATALKDETGAAWTNTNNKAIIGYFTYEAD